MSWRIEVRHVTGYQYSGEVAASYNEARLTPLSTTGQLTLDTRVEVSPATRVFRYWDYWGTLVHAFDVHEPHQELVVSAASVVETPTSHWTGDDEAVGWSELDDESGRDLRFEYLAPTRFVGVDAELADVAAGLRAAAPTPLDGVHAVVARVHEQLEYQPGSTSVSTSALEAWRAGQGVCQDFVHLTLALLRSMGVPGRYVSGYFHPQEDAPIGDTTVATSHAWAEAWIGGWFPFDPTNKVAVGERHVLVARGRDYRDVSPLKGVYSGAPSSTPTVTVELTRQRLEGFPLATWRDDGGGDRGGR